LSDQPLRIELKRADVRELISGDALLREAQVLKAFAHRLEDVLALGTARRYSDRAALFTQGERGDSLFFVLAGEVKLLRLTDKEQVELGVALKGDVLGEAEVLAGPGPRWCSAAARRAVDAVELPRAALLQSGALPISLRFCLQAVQQEREKSCDAMADFLNRW
jgi:CRP-like cAMP-binding protein